MACGGGGTGVGSGRGLRWCLGMGVRRGVRGVVGALQGDGDRGIVGGAVYEQLLRRFHVPQGRHRTGNVEKKQLRELGSYSVRGFGLVGGFQS